MNAQGGRKHGAKSTLREKAMTWLPGKSCTRRGKAETSPQEVRILHPCMLLCEWLMFFEENIIISLAKVVTQTGATTSLISHRRRRYALQRHANLLSSRRL